jgi:hypothetical protein
MASLRAEIRSLEQNSIRIIDTSERNLRDEFFRDEDGALSIIP